MPTYKLDIVVDGQDKGASSLLTGLGGLLSSLGKVALTAAAAGALAFGGALGGAVAKGMDFESMMSAVRADLQPTGAEFDALSAKALQLGKDTNFGAGEAAVAIDELARNGLNATQILNGAADATVNLAAATGLKGESGLATAATIATDTMHVFGIEAQDMARAINGISGVTVASKFDINDYQLALAQAGGVASATGVEFEDFNTTIAGISNLFASGSDAGTSFKTMLQRLIPQSKDAAGWMARLGIITADGKNQFFDASGQLRDMAEIAGILNTAMAGLSEEQKNEALSTIFGTDAMRAAVGLANLGEQGFNDLAASIGKVDAADQAATRLDNLSGDVEQLKGSLETVGIELGTAFIPLLRELTQGATDFINSNLLGRDWTPLVSGIQGTVGAVTGFVGAIQTAGGPAAYLEQQLHTLGDTAMRWATDAIPGAQTGLASYVQTLVSGVEQQGPALLDRFLGWRQGAIEWIAGAAPGALEALGTQYLGPLLDWLGARAVDLVPILGKWGARFVAWIPEAAPGLFQELLTLNGKMLTWIGERIPGIAAQLGEWAIAFIGWVGPAAGDLIVALGALFGEFLTWIIDGAPGLLSTLGTWTTAFVDWASTKLAPALLAGIGGLGLTVWNEIVRLWEAAFAPGTLGESLINGIMAGLSSNWSRLQTWFSAQWYGLVKSLPILGELADAAASINIPGFADGVTNFRGGLAIVGERGPELLNLPGGSDVIPGPFSMTTPLGGGGGGGGDFSWSGNLIVQGANDPQATARAVREELLKFKNRNLSVGLA